MKTQTTETITESDSLGLSYRISANGNIDIAGYKKPKAKSEAQKLKDEIEQKECRCFFAAMEINKRNHFKATEDKDLCCVNVSAPNWDGLEITLSPVEKQEIEENLEGTTVYDVPAWRIWIGESDQGAMILPAAIAHIRKWIVMQDLDDETRQIFDTYSNA